MSNQYVPKNRIFGEGEALRSPNGDADYTERPRIFKRGEVVIHKASKRPAVVLAIQEMDADLRLYTIRCDFGQKEMQCFDCEVAEAPEFDACAGPGY